MKHAALAAGLFASAVAISAPALAADMPLKALPPGPVTYDWSGVYIGGLIGGGWSTDRFNDSLGFLGGPLFLNQPIVQTVNGSGFIGGVEIGSNYQFGKLIIGWEADWTGGDIKGTNTASFATLAGIPETRTISANTDWTATVASRVGIAHNNWMLYGKAGTAFAHTNFTDNWTAFAAGASVFAGTGSSNRVGWMTGTGLEWAFATSWSLKVEYDYLNFGSRADAVNGTLGAALAGAAFPGSIGVQNDLHINQIKAGLNWRFMPNFW